MSWDVTFMKFSSNITSIEDIDESAIEELGDREDIIGILLNLFPDIDFTDKSWGTLERDGYSIEFNLGEEGKQNSIMLHVRGDKRSVEAIKVIAETTGWKAMDEEFINFDNLPERGLIEWQKAREHVVNNLIHNNSKKRWYEFWK